MKRSMRRNPASAGEMRLGGAAWVGAGAEDVGSVFKNRRLSWFGLDVKKATVSAGSGGVNAL